MMDLQTLHAAGAEIAGHADAWLRMRGIKSGEFSHKHDAIDDRVRKLRLQLGRRVLPTDLTGQPVPVCAGVELPKDKPLTPASLAQDNAARLTRDQVRNLQVQVEQAGSREAVAKRLNINAYTLGRALAGEPLLPETIARILGAKPLPPDGDIDPPGQAEPPGNPLPGEAPGQATIEPEPEPEPEPPPAQEATMSADPLCLQLIQATQKRGAKVALARHLDVNGFNVRDWMRAGKIPEQHRPGVEAWLAHPPTDTVARPTAKAVEKKPKAKAKPVSNAATDMIAWAVEKLGLVVTEAWLPDGETMRKVRVAVLP